MRPLLFLLPLAACSALLKETPEDAAAADKQLEAASVATDACAVDDSCDGSDAATGVLAIAQTEGDASADVTLLVDGTTTTVHSPTGAPVWGLEGRTVTLAVRGEWMTPTSVRLTDADGLAYVLESGAGDAFAAVEVAYGAELGSIVDDADYKRVFRELVVTTDDGPVTLQPGDVVTIHLDGLPYRFGAIAAYEIETIPGGEYTDCGGELPMLSYELLRIDAEQEFPAVVRPAGLEMAMYSGCG